MNNKPVKYTNSFYRKVCIAIIWFLSLYSTVIQFALFQIPYIMPLLGGAILLFYILDRKDKPFAIREVLTEEGICFLFYMAYMLIVGFLVSPNRNSHLNQWTTCLEYLFLSIVLTSLIKDSGTEAFHTMLLVQALALSFVFLRKPVYYSGGRYSISLDMNPNGLGMSFATGVWVTLFRQQEKKMPLIIVAVLVSLFGYCIFMTGSRKALIATGLIIILWLVLCYFPSIKEQGGYHMILSILVLCIIVFIVGRAFLSSYSDSTIATRMDNLLDETAEGKRSNMYRNGFALIKANPLFGLGFQGYRYYFGQYSHATLVEIPVSSGIIGSLIYLGIYYISIKRTLILYKKTRSLSLMTEHTKIKMVLALWAAMLFYTTCIIHQYQFDSFVLFGLIFGETANIEKKTMLKQTSLEKRKTGSKYIK